MHDEAEGGHLARPIRKEQNPKKNRDRVHRSRRCRTKEYHRQNAQHLSKTYRASEESQSQRIHDHANKYERRAQRYKHAVVPHFRQPERPENGPVAQCDPGGDSSAKEQVEKREEYGDAQGYPWNDVEGRLEAIPTQEHANGRPQDQAVNLAEHDEEHAGADFPARHSVSTIQIDRNSALTNLLVHQRENVRAGANGQDIDVAYLSV